MSLRHAGFAAALAAGTLAGCRARHAAPGPAHGSPAATQVAAVAAPHFAPEHLKIGLDYPAGWKPTPSSDYELLLTSTPPLPAHATISLDVPALPAHIPGLIPLGLVVNGYLDDLRKEGSVTIEEQKSTRLAGADARYVRILLHDPQGRDWRQAGILAVHSDHVYILRARSVAADFSNVEPAFQAIADSVRWR